MRQITPRELAEWLRTAPDLPKLLDVREPWEYKICRIPGSESIPMGQIPVALDRLDPEQAILVICHHGIRSQQVALFLEQQGFQKVFNLSGGINAWARTLDPRMPTY